MRALKVVGLAAVLALCSGQNVTQVIHLPVPLCTTVANSSAYTFWLNSSGSLASNIYTLNSTKEHSVGDTTGDGTIGGTAPTIVDCPADAGSKEPAGDCFYFNVTNSNSFLKFVVSSFDLVSAANNRIGFLMYTATITTNNYVFDAHDASANFWNMQYYGTLGDATQALKSDGTGTYPSGSGTSTRYFSNGTACAALTLATGWHYVELIYYATGSTGQLFNMRVDGTACGDVWGTGDDLKLIGGLTALEVGIYAGSSTGGYYLKNLVITNDNTIDLFSTVCGSDLTGPDICATGTQQGDYCH